MSNLDYLRKKGDIPAFLLDRIESDWSIESSILKPECQGPRIFCAACGFCSNEYYPIEDLRKNRNANVENRGR